MNLGWILSTQSKKMEIINEDFPEELLHSIFVFIHPKQTLSLQLTSKYWHSSFNNEILWKRYSEIYLPTEEIHLYENFQSWKQLLIDYLLFKLSSIFCSSNIKLFHSKKFAETDFPLQPVLLDTKITNLNNTFIINKLSESRKGFLGIGVVHVNVLREISFNEKLPKKYIGTYDETEFEIGYFDNGWFGSRYKGVDKWGREWYKGDSVKMQIFEDEIRFTLDKDLNTVYKINHQESLEDLRVIVNVNGMISICRNNLNFEK